jgi:hypothetical protein
MIILTRLPELPLLFLIALGFIVSCQLALLHGLLLGSCSSSRGFCFRHPLDPTLQLPLAFRQQLTQSPLQKAFTLKSTPMPGTQTGPPHFQKEIPFILP